MPDDTPAPVLPDGFDLEALLAPIPGDAPQGADLREDYSAQSPYFRLRDARSEAREAERRAESLGDDADGSTPAQWKTVVSLAKAALAERSKDIEIAAWLTEAMVRLNGLPGLTAGALLLRGLAERYWDGVFPLPDEDGISTRVAPVTGLSGAETDGTLMPALRRLPLFTRPSGQPFGWWEWERSQELGAIADAARRQARLDAGTLPPDEVEKEAVAAGLAHFGRLRRGLADASAAWGGMGEALDGLAGADGPSTGRVMALLRAMAEVVERFAPPAEAQPSDAVEEATFAEDGAAASAGAVPRAGGAAPGRSREEYLRQLVEIADYFRRTEPNSPLAYTLQDAVRRARLSWPDLLVELVPDETTRIAILTSLGIKPPEPPSE
ncbi:MAG TPA: type VI secretion system protein TssA [Falsiroseomonas sp.]|jgi:type VI secretion system protein ImpA|nr:type VI secretion system protein TssA [Falsiroseomonas sp.]